MMASRRMRPCRVANRMSYLRSITVEHLEARRLLVAPTVDDVEPDENSLGAAIDTEITATFDQTLDSQSVSGQSFVVHAGQTGQLLTPSNLLSVDDKTVKVQPTQSLHAGEMIQVTATSGVQNQQGESATPYVWRFRTEVGPNATSAGTGRFGDSGQRFGNGNSLVAVPADLDGDGDLDVVVASRPHFEASSQTDIMLNDGQGRFHESDMALRASFDIAVGDIDGDGDLDLVGGTYEGVLIWENDGDGRFEDERLVATPMASDVELADMDVDGDLDLVVVSNQGPARVWFNTGVGTFENSGQNLHTNQDLALAVADVDGDGDLDALVTGYTGNQLWVNDGSGILSAHDGASDTLPSGAVTLGDIDADGDLDAMFATTRNMVDIRLNDGSGSFHELEMHISQPGPASLSDIDGDGYLDALLSDGTLWTNDGSGAFQQSAQRLSPGLGVFADFDGDTDLDVFLATWRANEVWMNVEVDADLSISVTNPPFYTAPNEQVSYVITAVNSGPSDVLDAQVMNSFPDQLQDVTWSCVASAGSACTQDGTGDIQDTVSLLAGGSVQYTAVATVSPNASGQLRNEASVALPVGQDLTPSNDVASAVNLVPLITSQPLPNTHSISSEGNLTAIYDRAIDSSSVTPESFVVHGYQNGKSLDADNLTTEDETVSFRMNRPLHAGELLQVTSTADLKYASGENAQSHVWQYRAGVGPDFATGIGTGIFGRTDQNLGDTASVDAKLGDIDGDGDLDAIVIGSYEAQTWLNDGTGLFTLSGGGLGDGFERNSITLGDLDGDGDLDVISANGQSHQSRNEVWLNNGAGRFRHTGQNFGRERTSQIALGDIDGDGDLDAIFANHSVSNEVWLNDGNGSFQSTGQSLERGGFSNEIELGDFDHDGDLDVIFSSGGLWLNNGDGHFRDSGQRFGDGERPGMDSGDLDADGDLDLFANGMAWSNDGNGVFRPAGHVPVSEFGTVSLIDVEGDGDLDLYSGGYGVNRIWLNDGAGSFHPGASLGDSFPLGTDFGDLDGDGDVDAFLAIGIEPAPDQIWLNANLQADLSITVDNSQQYAVPGNPVTYTITARNTGPDAMLDATVIDDFPLQIQDISWTCTATEGSSCSPSGTGDINDTVSLIAGGVVTYTASGVVSTNVSEAIRNTAIIVGPGGQNDLVPSNNVAIDVDVILPFEIDPLPNTHDAPRDVVPTVSFYEPLNADTVTPQTFVAHASQTGQLVEPASLISVDEQQVSWEIARPLHAGEQLQFTVTDEVRSAGNAEDPSAFVWQIRNGVGDEFATHLGTGVFERHDQSLGTADSLAIVLGDLDGDGDLDAFVDNWSSELRRNRVWLNDGDANFVDTGRDIGFDFTHEFAIGDVDADGDLDVISANLGNSSTVFLNIGNGAFSESNQRIRRSGTTNGIALGDIDGDGDLDALFANQTEQSKEPNDVWLNDGNGQFHESGQKMDASRRVKLGDMDGDGDLDAFLVGDGPNKIWFNNGDGTFSDSGQNLGHRSSFEVALGDVDADGDLDAVVANRQQDRVWINDGAGHFEDSNQSLNGSLTNDIKLGDLDGDGDLDIVIATGSGRRNYVYQNDGSGEFTRSMDVGVHDVAAIDIGDLDGDGDLDAFLGVRGANQVWLNQNPVRIPGDSNNDGVFNSSDLVLVFQAGKYEDGIDNNAIFAEGDWNEDGDFDSSDLVFAFQEGNYVRDARALTNQFAAAVDLLFDDLDDHPLKRNVLMADRLLSAAQSFR